MNGNRKWFLFALAILPVSLGNGCPGDGGNPPGGTPLAGLWSLSRGAIHLTFSWASGSGEDITQESETGKLQPVDVDALPDALKPLGQQWNDGLAALNDGLDKAFPPEVIITFPRFATIRVENPADPASAGEGLINDELKYLFAGDWSGAGDGSDQGGGAVLQLSTVEGQFDAGARTTTGKVARTLVLAAVNEQGGAVLTIQLSVDYSGQRIGDVPAPQP